jgi:hypothetical protein
MDHGKLKLQTKKLHSGRFQISFATEGADGYYGYLLAEPKTAVTDIIEKISRHVAAMESRERYFQRNLFSFGNRQTNSGKILIYKK